MKKEPYLLNIAPLLPGHESELATDIASLAKDGSITHNAFIFTINPEGNPPVDKVSVLGKYYMQHVVELRKISTVPCGILLQATMGHGKSPNVPTEGQKFIRWDGKNSYTFCPLDTGFQKYIAEQIRRVAGLKPDFLMLDDDFRMLTSRNGCFCPLHIARFNKITGENYTAESLREAILKDKSVAHAYDTLLLQTLGEVARIIRGTIDSVAPGLPCSYCMCSGDVRHAPSIAGILRGNAPLRIRINNGYYMRESVRDIPRKMLDSAAQTLYLPEGTEILDEPDTCPQNRYATSASILHNHLTRAFIAGYSGAKIWITRRAVEFASGSAYRKVLTKYNKFYRALYDLGLKEDGILIPLPSEAPFNFPPAGRRKYETGNWLSQTAVMGFPFHINKTSWRNSSAAALAGDDCDILSDTEIEKLFDLDLILDGSAALKLSRRGFAAKLGITAEEWGDLPAPSFEAKKDLSAQITLAIPNKPVRLSINSGVQGEILTWISHQTSNVSDDAVVIAPGSIQLKRPDGHSLFVTAISLTTYCFDFSLFAFLNETRKAQFAELFKNQVGVYYRGDAEVMMQSGRDREGNRIAILHSISPDELGNPCLVFREDVNSIERLMPDGSWKQLSFVKDGKGVQLDLSVKMLYPEVLRVK